MTKSPVFVLDSSVFMEAARRYYGLDFAPGFWDALAQHGTQGNLLSVDYVEREIRRGGDDLAAWTQDTFKVCFASCNDGCVIGCYGNIMIWLGQQVQYSPEAVSKFVDGADPWLTAYAMAYDCTLVTQEQYAASAKRKVPIPNVCHHFGVACVDTFTMIRALGIKLKL